MSKEVLIWIYTKYNHFLFEGGLERTTNTLLGVYNEGTKNGCCQHVKWACQKSVPAALADQCKFVCETLTSLNRTLSNVGRAIKPPKQFLVIAMLSTNFGIRERINVVILLPMDWNIIGCNICDYDNHPIIFPGMNGWTWVHIPFTVTIVEVLPNFVMEVVSTCNSKTCLFSINNFYSPPYITISIHQKIETTTNIWKYCSICTCTIYDITTIDQFWPARTRCQNDQWTSVLQKITSTVV